MLTTKELIAKPTGYLFAFYDESAYFTSTFISFLKDIGLSVADFLKSLTQFTIHHPAQAITLGLAAQMGALSTRSLYSSGDNEFFPLAQINFTDSNSDSLLYINNLPEPKLERNKRQVSGNINLPKNLPQNLPRLNLPPMKDLDPIDKTEKNGIENIRLPNIMDIKENFQRQQEILESHQKLLIEIVDNLNGIIERTTSLTTGYNNLNDQVLFIRKTGFDLIGRMSQKVSNDTTTANSIAKDVSVSPSSQEESANATTSNSGTVSRRRKREAQRSALTNTELRGGGLFRISGVSSSNDNQEQLHSKSPQHR